MVAKKTTLEELGEMLAHVVKHMATKDDIAEFKKEFNDFVLKTDENFRAYVPRF